MKSKLDLIKKKVKDIVDNLNRVQHSDELLNRARKRSDKRIKEVKKELKKKEKENKPEIDK